MMNSTIRFILLTIYATIIRLLTCLINTTIIIINWIDNINIRNLFSSVVRTSNRNQEAEPLQGVA